MAVQPLTREARSGMGAVVFEGGVAFRVWAPNADYVGVAGSFNDWSETSLALASEGNGYWYGEAPDAKAGDEYRYLIRNGEEKLWKNDPYARELTHSIGNSIIHETHYDWADQDFEMPPRNELITYELHVGTFYRRNPKIPGTFAELEQRLDYLKQLGINLIELMPVCEFEGDISWGYNMGHIFAVESSYGGPQALKKFVNAAHRKGIAVILDVVYNHLGPNHLDLWRFDGWYEEDRGGIYFFQDERANTPWGDTRPDFGRPEVRQYLIDNLKMWIEEYHFDGVRVDSTVNIYGIQNAKWDYLGDIPEGWSFLQWATGEIEKVKPGVLLSAEDLQDKPAITQPVEEGGLGFHTQWDQSFHDQLRDVLIAVQDEDRDLNLLVDVLTKNYNGDPFQRTIYLETHDEVGGDEEDKIRIRMLIDPGNPEAQHAKKRASIGAAVLFTTPGIPIMFQGQEFMYVETFNPSDPLEWDALSEMRGIHRLYRDLIAFRRNLNANTAGLSGAGVNVYHVNHEQKVLAYHRFREGGAGDDVVVVINLRNETISNYTIGFPRPGVWKLRFNSDFEGYDPDFGDYHSFDSEAGAGEADGLPAQGVINCAPYSVLIFSQ